MAEKNKRKKERQSGSGETIGLILMIVATFFLVCLCTTLLASIGTAVKSLFTGLLGFFAYAAFALMLVAGFLMMRKSTLVVRKKWVLLIVLSSFFLLCVLQLATSGSFLKLTMGEYISNIYEHKTAKTIGGLLFGIFAFAAKSAFTVVGAYIFFSVLTALCLGILGMDIYKAKKPVPVGRRNYAPREKSPTRAASQFVKSGAEAAPVKPIVNHGLFIGNIVPKEERADFEEGSFTALTAKEKKAAKIDREENDESGAKKLSDYFASIKGAEEVQEKKRINAHDVLFDGKDRMADESAQRFLSKSNQHKELPRDILFTAGEPEMPYKAASAPNIAEKQNAVSTNLHDKEEGGKKKPERLLPEVVFPPAREVEPRFVAGDIINAEYYSSEIKQQDKPQPFTMKNTSFVDEGYDFSAEANYASEFVSQSPKLVANPDIRPEDKNNFGGDSAHEWPKFSPGEIINCDEIEISRTTDEPKSVYDKNCYELPEGDVTRDDFGFYSSYFGDSKGGKTAAEAPKTTDKKDGWINEEADAQAAASVSQDEIENADEIVTNDSLEHYENKSDYSVIAREKFVSPVKEPIFDYDELSAEAQFEEEAAEFSLKGNSFDNDAYNVYENEVNLSDEKGELTEQADSGESAESDEQLYGFTPDENDGFYAPDNKAALEAAVQTINQPPPQSLAQTLSDEDAEQEEDYTGYYIKQKTEKESSFSQRAAQLDKKIDPKNQINMETYLFDTASVEPPKPRKRRSGRYQTPPSELLTTTSSAPEDFSEDYESNAMMLEETLKNLKLPAKVIGITRGPAVTRYELEMPPGYTVKKIEGFSQDIAYSLASAGGIRIEAPIPGKRAVGVEVPNKSIGIVSLRELIESPEFIKSSSALTMCIGKDIAGKPVICSLDKMPHLLVAGSTNSGKSACLHSLIISMLYKSSPADVRLILIDPKRVEFPFYKNLRHLMINTIINEREHAINAFKWVREEMEERYRLLAKYNSRNLQEYNSCAAVKSGEAEKLPSIVIIVDELSDLMQGGYKKEMEEHILSIAQKARASGVHLILATQRPSVDVITGTIKINLPSRIALAVSNAVDSKTILDQGGAEMLLGRGDLLFAPVDASEPKRIQGSYVTKEEIEAIVEFINENHAEDFYDEAEQKIMNVREEKSEAASEDNDSEEGHDPVLEEVARKVIETNQASTSMIQRRFKLGYARASRIIDQMEQFNFIGAMDINRPTKPREVYITREMFKEFFGKDY